jgi:membrane protein
MNRRPFAGVNARVRDRFERSLAGRLVERILELNPIERGLALGSKLFTAVVPAAILVSSLLSSPDALPDRLIDGLGLTGAGAAAVRRLFEVPSGSAGVSVSVVGVLVLVYSLVSFARALQRLYEDAWHLPGLRTGVAWGLVWLVAFSVYFSLTSPVSRLLHRHGLTVSAFLVSIIGGAVLWSVTPTILLGRRVPLRALRRGGILTAILLTVFNVGTRIYIPHSMTTNITRYGLVGATFTLLSWLFAFSLVLVVSAAGGAVLSEAAVDQSATQARDAPRA